MEGFKKNLLKNSMKPFKLKEFSWYSLVGDPPCQYGVSRLAQNLHDLDQLATTDPERIASIDSLGMVVAESYKSYFAQRVKRLLQELKKLVSMAYLGEKVAADALYQEWQSF